MGRWSQYDEDDYRLPEGMKRIGYDSDSGRYYFRDSDGSYWKGAPGEEFGQMTTAGEVPDAILSGSSGVGGGESSSGLNAQSGKRMVSGISVVSGRSFGSSTLVGGGGSPAQKKDKEKEEQRDRTPLTFKKDLWEFLRAKLLRGSTATIATSMTSVMAGGPSSSSGSHTVPAASSLAVTPSHAVSSYPFDKEGEGEKEKTPHISNNNTLPTNSPGSPFLKSKEFAVSVGAQSRSLDQSTNRPYVDVEVPDASLGISFRPVNAIEQREGGDIVVTFDENLQTGSSDPNGQQ